VDHKCCHVESEEQNCPQDNENQCQEKKHDVPPRFKDGRLDAGN
jgi:hypothetical protein